MKKLVALVFLLLSTIVSAMYTTSPIKINDYPKKGSSSCPEFSASRKTIPITNLIYNVESACKIGGTLEAKFLQDFIKSYEDNCILGTEIRSCYGEHEDFFNRLSFHRFAKYMFPEIQMKIQQFSYEDKLHCLAKLFLECNKHGYIVDQNSCSIASQNMQMYMEESLKEFEEIMFQFCNQMRRIAACLMLLKKSSGDEIPEISYIFWGVPTFLAEECVKIRNEKQRQEEAAEKRTICRTVPPKGNSCHELYQHQ